MWQRWFAPLRLVAHSNRSRFALKPPATSAARLQDLLNALVDDPRSFVVGN